MSFSPSDSVVFLRQQMPPLLLEQNLLAAAVIEFRGSAVGMPGNPLSGFQGAVIFQKIRDAGRPEGNELATQLV